MYAISCLLLPVKLLCKGGRRKITESRLPPSTIVKDLDVLGDRMRRLCAGRIAPAVNSLILQCASKNSPYEACCRGSFPGGSSTVAGRTVSPNPDIRVNDTGSHDPNGASVPMPGVTPARRLQELLPQTLAPCHRVASRTRSSAGARYQRPHQPGSRHRPTLLGPLADPIALQVDQAASSHQDLPRAQRKRGTTLSTDGVNCLSCARLV